MDEGLQYSFEEDMSVEGNKEARENLNRIIDDIYEGKKPDGNQVIYAQTPKVLQDIGAQNLRLLMSPNEMMKAILTKE